MQVVPRKVDKELPVGTALPSIISALSGAASTTITDHPSSPALTTGAIEQNVKVNVLERNKRTKPDAARNSPISNGPLLSAPPDENWVIVGYLAAGQQLEQRFEWQVFSPPAPGGGATCAFGHALAIKSAMS